MADLKPIGSEKLKGMEQINRIIEISRYKEVKSEVNESKSDYTIQLSDGNYYGIVNEKNGYIVKRGINESEMDYIEPMQNRRYYKSYSQAMKKLNLLAGEINRLTEHTENISLIGEQKKFVLKTPESSDMGGETPPPPPAEEPMGNEGNLDLGMDDAPMGDEEGLDLGMDDAPVGDEEGLDLGMDDEGMGAPEKDDEDVTFKAIQKLTGKLGQKLRTLDSNEGLNSEDIKYVLNSVISAVNLENLSEEDKEDILSNFEEEIDYDDMEGDMDLGGEDDMDLDMGGEDDMDLDMGDEAETEELGEDMLDEIFIESNVEKVLTSYFDISEEESKLTESKKVKSFIKEKIEKVKTKSRIKELSESFEQENSSEFILKENKNAKFIGKTNKGNLVFNINEDEIKISPAGEIL